jgi:hypothetical protein
MAFRVPSFFAAAPSFSLPPKSAAEVAVDAFLPPDVLDDTALGEEPQAVRERAAAVSPAARATDRILGTVTGSFS